MSQKLVSVVIPVYNTEKYLRQCLDSVVSQSYTKLEIIVVDDGSSDASGVICDGYAAKDERVLVFHQENQGAAAARKNGVQKATGEYICFVDSDDTISADMIRFMVENVGECDLITTGCRCYKPDGEEYQRYDAFAEGVYETQAELDYLISNMITYEGRMEDGFLPFLVNKMYRTNIIKQIIGTVDLSIFYAEDRDLLFRYILKCKSICITRGLYYNYLYREGSAVQSMDPHILSNLNALYFSLGKAFDGHPKNEVLMCQLQRFIVSRLYWIPMWMAFSKEAQMLRYLMPMGQDVFIGKNVVLYGAGQVGMDYYTQICAGSRFKLVAWVDKNPKEGTMFPVKSKQELLSLDFDVILIAVAKETVAEEIKRELVTDGIPEDKLCWSAPIAII